MVKIGSAVHTVHGLGKVTEVDTVRGRSQYKVAGAGFAVWLDETKVAALGDVDESNSTTLPYDYEPQNPVETFSEESDFSPTHSVDADERLSPTNSVTGDSESDPQPSPGPSPDLFAKSAGNDWPSEYDEGDESDYTTDELAEMGERHNAEAEAMYREYLEDKARENGSGLSDKDLAAFHDHDPAYMDGVRAMQARPVPEELDESLPGHKHAAGGWGDVDLDGGEEPDESRGENRPGSHHHYEEYAHRNGLHPGDDLTADRYAREHGIPIANASDLAMQIGRHASRPAGLSDKYIDLLPTHTAAYDDPVEQFRRDPITAIQRTAYLVESSTGLDPRMGQYMDLVEADPIIREAAWSDVRTKAMRLKTSGAVHVKDMAPNRIMAAVDGDNGTYDVVIYKGASLTGSNSIDQWHCGCEWGKWAFRRKHTFVGRLCSHGLAAYFTMQSAHMTGNPRQTKLPKHKSPSRSLPFLHVKRGGVATREFIDWCKENGVDPYNDPDAETIWARNLHQDSLGDIDFADLDLGGESHEKPLEWGPEERNRHYRAASIVDDFKDWVRDVNKGHVDIGAADDFLAQYPGDPSVDDVNDVIEYAHDNPAVRPERNYESGTTFDLDKAYKKADATPPVLKNIPDRITPDYYVVPDGEEQHFIDVEKDERKTTGPDQITKSSKVDKSWAKNHGDLDDEDTPIVRFSARKEALTYTADENLIQHLRDLSAESPEESYGNKAERNEEVREVVQELRDRGYDASQFVAMVREAAGKDDEKKYTIGGPSDVSTSGHFYTDTATPNIPQAPGPGKNYQDKGPTDEQIGGIFEQGLGAGSNAGGLMGTDALNKGDNTKAPAPAAAVVNKTTGPANSGPAGGGGSGGGSGAGGGGGGSDWTPNGNTDAIGAGDYKIQKGDTLTSIMDRAKGADGGLGVSDLAKANSIANPDLIFAGDTLHIPGKAGGDTPAAPAAGGPPPVEPGAADPMSGTPGVPPAPGPTPPQANAGPPPDSPGAATFAPGAPVPPTAGGPAHAAIRAARLRYAEETGRLSPRGVPVPGNGPGMDETPDVGSKREDPKPQTLEERLPGPGQTSAPSDPMSGLIGGAGGAGLSQFVGPAVSGITQGISGLVGGGGGLGGLASGIGGALSGLMSLASVDNNYGPTDSEPDPSFAGTGPYIKDWWTTSEDYVEEHERGDMIDLTDGDGDITGYTKPRQQPKQASYDDDTDIVRQFQANIGNTALGSGAGGGGTFSDAAIAERAQGFLRTAGRVYSLAEQQELIDEAHPKGARNLSGLDLRGTHYLDS